jgi:orotate phosphoribosyltransferase
MGGIILAQWTGHHLGCRRSTPRRRRRRHGAEARLRQARRGKRVLVVEDVLNTGGSIKETIAPCARPAATSSRRPRS